MSGFSRTRVNILTAGRDGNLFVTTQKSFCPRFRKESKIHMKTIQICTMLTAKVQTTRIFSMPELTPSHTVQIQIR